MPSKEAGKVVGDWSARRYWIYIYIYLPSLSERSLRVLSSNTERGSPLRWATVQGVLHALGPPMDSCEGPCRDMASLSLWGFCWTGTRSSTGSLLTLGRAAIYLAVSGETANHKTARHNMAALGNTGKFLSLLYLFFKSSASDEGNLGGTIIFQRKCNTLGTNKDTTKKSVKRNV